MGWTDTYRRKVTSAEDAVKLVRSGDHVWLHAGCNNPEELLKALVGRAGELHDVEVTHLLTFGAADHVDPKYSGSFRHRALFTGPNVRQAVNEGRADYVPVFLSEIPGLIRSRAIPVDVAFIHISPPDEHGFCSYGVGVECTKAAAESARAVVALGQPADAAVARRLLHPRVPADPRRRDRPTDPRAAAVEPRSAPSPGPSGRTSPT